METKLWPGGPGQPCSADAFYMITRATIAPVTGPDPLALRAAAHASRVAPVVATSSTSSRGLPPRSGPRQGECPANVLQAPQAVQPHLRRGGPDPDQLAWRLGSSASRVLSSRTRSSGPVESPLPEPVSGGTATAHEPLDHQALCEQAGKGPSEPAPPRVLEALDRQLDRTLLGDGRAQAGQSGFRSHSPFAHAPPQRRRVGTSAPRGA